MRRPCMEGALGGGRLRPASTFDAMRCIDGGSGCSLETPGCDEPPPREFVLRLRADEEALALPNGAWPCSRRSIMVNA